MLVTHIHVKRVSVIKINFLLRQLIFAYNCDVRANIVIHLLLLIPAFTDGKQKKMNCNGD